MHEYSTSTAVLILSCLLLPGCQLTEGRLVYRSARECLLVGQDDPEAVCTTAAEALQENGLRLTKQEQRHVAGGLYDKQLTDAGGHEYWWKSVDVRTRASEGRVEMAVTSTCRFQPGIGKHPWTAVPDLINDMIELERKVHASVAAEPREK